MLTSIEKHGPPPTYPEFLEDFHPEVNVDSHFVDTFNSIGVEVEVDETALALNSYAVNPYGYTKSRGKKEKPLKISYGEIINNSSPNSKHILGQYKRRDNQVHIYGDQFNKGNILPVHTDLEDCYFVAGFCNIMQREMNSTLIHELSHAADANLGVKTLRTSEITLIAGGVAALHQGAYWSTLLALEHQTDLAQLVNDIPGNTEVSRIIAATSVALLTVGSTIKVTSHNLYLRSSEETRARIGEHASPSLPPVLKLTLLNLPE